MTKVLTVNLTPTNNNIVVRSQHGQSSDGKADPNKQQYYSGIPHRQSSDGKADPNKKQYDGEIPAWTKL